MILFHENHLTGLPSSYDHKETKVVVTELMNILAEHGNAHAFFSVKEGAGKHLSNSGYLVSPTGYRVQSSGISR